MQGSKRDTDVNNRLLDCVEEVEGGMIWESSTETCIYPSVKYMTSASSGHEAEHSEQVLWDNPWDGVGREVRGEFRMEGHVCPPGWFMLMFGKKHNIVK